MEIRTFTEPDRAALRALFGRVGEGAPSALWGHEESEAAIYLTPYMDLEPESLFIAFEGDAMVGYLTGCLDGARFPTESERFDRAVKEHRLVFQFQPMRFFIRSMADIAVGRIRGQPTARDFDDARWPSHLHINVLPNVRGAGAAPALMQRWFARLAEAGSPGCHLQTLVENTRAVRFFERMGFTELGSTPLVPGVRDHGQRVHQQTMVRPLDPERA
jgi:ribosomal protein S18 acetylase RimI-like enzyme